MLRAILSAFAICPITKIINNDQTNWAKDNIVLLPCLPSDSKRRVLAGAFETPISWEGEAAEGQQWYHSTEL